MFNWRHYNWDVHNMGILSVFAMRCFLCLEEEETTNHLPLHCFSQSDSGIALFSFGCLFGKLYFGVGYPLGVEAIICKKGLEQSMESETFMYLLDSLENLLERCCF